MRRIPVELLITDPTGKLLEAVLLMMPFKRRRKEKIPLILLYLSRAIPHFGLSLI